MDRSTVNKLQHQYWVTKQTVYRKLGKKEDECIVASDSELDAKLELFKSIRQTSGAMNKLLERYQDKICALAQEQNEMGRFLKEHGKADKSPAGKMMIQMGKSLIYSSQQEIALRPPLLRLYQEVETFRNRAVDDSLGTIRSMEKHRTEYRAALNWMKKVSQELDPDTDRQMEKFRKVQNHVKTSKYDFDKLKLACLQKVDLLAAARCNMFSHALIQYLQSMTKVTAKNAKIFNTLAITFKGHQYYEFSYIKELAEPSKKLAEECGNKPATEELLFDFNDDLKESESQDSAAQKSETGGPNAQPRQNEASCREGDLLGLEKANELLETLLGPMDQSPEIEKAQDAIADLGLDLPSKSQNDKEKEAASSNSLINIGSFIPKKEKNKESQKDNKQDDVMSLLSSEDFEGFTMEQEGGDTLALLNEILSAGNQQKPVGPAAMPPLIPAPESEGASGDFVSKPTSSTLSGLAGFQSQPSSFMPSHLLDLRGLNLGGPSPSDTDLLNLGHESNLGNEAASKVTDDDSSTNKAWYDIFADLDPLGNPDAIGDKEKGDKEFENRYC